MFKALKPWPRFFAERTKRKNKSARKINWLHSPQICPITHGTNVADFSGNFKFRDKYKFVYIFGSTFHGTFQFFIALCPCIS